MSPSPIQKFIESGVQFTEMSRKQAESVVKSMVSSGEVQRKDAEQTIKRLLERGKETSDRISAMVQDEVAKQVSAAQKNFQELEERVEALAAQIRSATSAAPQRAAKKAPTKQAPAKKKAAAKKAPAKKKATAKKAPAKKKAAAKKAAAKKAVGSSGVRKVSTARKR